MVDTRYGATGLYGCCRTGAAGGGGGGVDCGGHLDIHNGIHNLLSTIFAMLSSNKFVMLGSLADC